MKLNSKIKNIGIVHTYTSSELNPSNGEFLQSTKNTVQDALRKFNFAVDNESFYEISEFIFANFLDPEEMAKCAELAGKREPGGSFYRAKLWAKIFQILNTPKINEPNTLKFNQLCFQVGIHLTRAKNIVFQGQTILEVEKLGINTANLRTVSPLFFNMFNVKKIVPKSI